MYFNDKNEEKRTKILLTEIKIEDLLEEKNILLEEMEELGEKLEKKNSLIGDLREEIEELKKKETLSPNEKNWVQSSITRIFDIEDEISHLQKEIDKRKIKEVSEDVVVIGFSEHKEKLQLPEEKFIEVGTKNDLEKYAREIYSALRKADKLNPKLILIEGVKREGIGIAIMNRLLRAASYDVLEDKKS